MHLLCNVNVSDGQIDPVYVFPFLVLLSLPPLSIISKFSQAELALFLGVSKLFLEVQYNIILHVSPKTKYIRTYVNNE